MGRDKDREREKTSAPVVFSELLATLKNFLSFKEIFTFGKLREFHDHCTLKKQNKKLRLFLFGADSQRKQGAGSLDHLGI